MALSAREGGGNAGASGAEDASIADIVVALRGATAVRADHAVAPLRPAGLAGPSYDAPLAAEGRDVAAADPGAPQRLPAAPPAAEGELVLDNLRDAEIARLIAQNHRLNEQIFQLLKIIEREKERVARQRAADAARQMPVPLEPGESVGREVRVALEAELRPILGALLRLVQRMAAERAPQRAAVAAEAPVGEKPGPAASAPPPPAPARPLPAEPFGGDRDRHANWIIDLIRAASDRGGVDHDLPRSPAPPARPTGEREGGFLARLRNGMRRFGAGD